MSRRSEVADFLKVFLEKNKDTSISLGSWANSIESLVLQHEQSQPEPDKEINRLRGYLFSIAKWPERSVNSRGEKEGPEWMLYEVKKFAQEALSETQESKPS